MFAQSCTVVFGPVLLDDAQVSGLNPRSSFAVMGLEIVLLEFRKIL